MLIERRVLNKGYVKLLNIAGANPGFKDLDRNCAQCARYSFDNFEEERTLNQDMKLTAYLINNSHWSPLEMTCIWLRMKLPIFIARQFIRHKSASVNEVSARYTQLPSDWYIPKIIGSRPTNGMKQGQSNGLSKLTQSLVKLSLNTQCWLSYKLYQLYLFFGVAPEHARMVLHLNHYTKWIWRQNLRDILIFLRLRMDSHAQIEAREYANAIHDMLAVYIPETIKVFDAFVAKEVYLKSLTEEELQVILTLRGGK